jgi:integrase
MQAKITAKTIAAMSPGAEVLDTEIRGFSARCGDSGKVTYSLRYRTANGRKRFPIGVHGNVTPDEARKIAKQRAGEIAGGTDPAAERKIAKAVAGKTVSAVWDEYVKRELSQKRSAKDQCGSFERLVRPRIGDKSIYELKRSDMVKLFDTIADNNGHVMADRMMSYLGACFRWQQVRDDEFVSPIITGMARTSGKELARERTLTDDELRKLWKVTADGTFGALIRFLLLTAARRSEAAEMTWQELDGTTWILPAPRNKVKAELVRPLSADAMAIVKKFPKSVTYVFAIDGEPITGFSSRKQGLDKASGVTNWRIHDLRRTARSLLSRAGVSSDVAELCLGHVLPGIRGTYDRHSYLTEKADAFEKLAALVRDIVG